MITKILLALSFLAIPAIADDWAVMSSTGPAVVIQVIEAQDDFVAAHPEIILVKPSIKVSKGWKYDGVNFTSNASTVCIVPENMR